jgi:hypothetical protein
MELDKLRGVNSSSPTSMNSAPRWRIVALVLLVAGVAIGVVLALVYGGKMMPLLDSL